MTLVIDLDVEQADGIRIWGARSRPLVLGTSKPRRLMAAHFKPGGGFPFADCPAGELHNEQCHSQRSGQAKASDFANVLLKRRRIANDFNCWSAFSLTAYAQADGPIPRFDMR